MNMYSIGSVTPVKNVVRAAAKASLCIFLFYLIHIKVDGNHNTHQNTK